MTVKSEVSDNGLRWRTNKVNDGILSERKVFFEVTRNRSETLLQYFSALASIKNRAKRLVVSSRLSIMLKTVDEQSFQ